MKNIINRFLDEVQRGLWKQALNGEITYRQANFYMDICSEIQKGLK